MSNRSREALVLGGSAVLLLVYAVWRATIGITLTDDGYYVAMGMRLAQGARVFTDERFVQALGFLVTGPVTKLWTALFGLDYLALALRIFYIVLAALAGAFAYRALSPRFGRTPSAVAVTALLLAPPFNILAVSYNSLGLLCLLLGCALGWSAVSDRRPAAAASAVLVLALGSVSYPPLVLPAGALFVTMALMARDRAVSRAMVIAAAAAVAVFLAWFFAASSVEGFRQTLRFAEVHRTVGLTADGAWSGIVIRMWDTMSGRFYLPMWFLAIVAAVAPHVKLRAAAEALVPFAAAYPGLRALAAGTEGATFGGVGASYLLALALGLALPVAVGVVREGDRDGRRLLALAAPAGLLGYAVVTYTTQAGWHWGMSLVAAAPLVMAEIVLSLRRIGDTLGTVVLGLVSVGLVGLLVVLLTVAPFKTERPWRLDTTIAEGAYAGLRTDGGTAATMARISDAGRRWVGPDDTVFVMSGAGAYPLIGGRMLTPSVWLNAGPTSQAAVAYFDEKGTWPDVIFMKPAPADLGAGDPLLARIRADYREVDLVEGFTVWEREGR